MSQSARRNPFQKGAGAPARAQPRTPRVSSRAQLATNVPQQSNYTHRAAIAYGTAVPGDSQPAEQYSEPEFAPEFGPQFGFDESGECYDLPASTDAFADCDCGMPTCGCGDACADGQFCAECGGTCGPTCQQRNRGTTINGWLAQGFTFNPQDPNDGFNGPLTFNDRSNEYQLNQLYLTLEDCVDAGGCDWDLGGRVDLLYGTDYFFTTATGLEVHRDGSPKWNGDDGPRAQGATLYGLAMPQLYAEAFAPVGNGLWVKMGHFYSPVGYESVMYTANFFYSHSYIKQYGEPFTHTGLLAEYRLSAAWSAYSGFTRGWNTWEDVNGQLGYLGGLAWCRPDCRESLRFFLHAGNEDEAGQNNRTAYSLVYTTQIGPRFAYVLEHNLGVEDNAAIRRNFDAPALWYGIAQYFVYQVNCQTQAGLRAEWFRDEDNSRVLGIPVSGSVGGNYVEVTAGANYRPAFIDRLEIRPELRWDWSDTQNESLGVRGMFDDFSKHYQVTLALSGVVCF